VHDGTPRPKRLRQFRESRKIEAHERMTTLPVVFHYYPHTTLVSYVV